MAPELASRPCNSNSNSTQPSSAHTHLLLQDARQNEPPARPAVAREPRLQLQQRPPQDIGQHQVKLTVSAARQLQPGSGEQRQQQRQRG